MGSWPNIEASSPLPGGRPQWRERENSSLARSVEPPPTVDSTRRNTIGHSLNQAPPAQIGSGTEIVLTDVSGCSPSNASVLHQLDRVLRSKPFVQSEKLGRFLRFVVGHVLQGNRSCLKEYLVGVEVYDRKPPYDPSQDSIVRTEARRLRNKLKEYYGDEGKEDPVYIYLRPGSYVPAFQCREDLIGTAVPVLSGTALARRSSPIPTVVMPFRDISGNEISASFARAIPDELAYALMLNSGCTVVSPASIGDSHPEATVTTIMNKVGAQIAFEGSARAEGANLRVTARIIDAAGTQLWLRRIDTEIGSQAIFAIEEHIARELSLGLHAVREAAAEKLISSHC